MHAGRVRAAAVGLLGVLAIGATAATMDGSRQRSGSGGATGVGRGSGDGSGIGRGSGEAFQMREKGVTVDFGFPVAEAFGVIVALGAAFLVVYAGYLYWQDGLDGLLSLARVSRDVVIGVGLVGVLAALVLWQFFASFEPSSNARPERVEPGSAGQSAADATSQTGGLDPVVVLVVGGALVLVVAAALLATGRLDLDRGGDDGGDDDSVDREDPTGEVGTPVSTPPLDDVDASNGVYRAWRELAASVDGVGGRTLTPAEVARRAIDDGLDGEAVRAITETFAEVRYGGRPATEDRESRARAALDRLDGGDGA